MHNTPGNGITVQSNTGLIGTTLYNTTNIIVRNNTITDSRGAGIQFGKITNSVATDNSITGTGYCFSILATDNTTIGSNGCVGLGLKSVNNTNLISDIAAGKPSASVTRLKTGNRARRVEVWMGLGMALGLFAFIF